MLISSLLALGQYALLARAHHSERGIGTIAFGGGLLAASGIVFTLLLKTPYSTVALFGVLGGLTAFGLVGLFLGPVILAVAFLVIGSPLLPSKSVPIALLVTLCISQLALSYCYHNALSHRLHTRLIKLARYDALTGLLNRRGIEEIAIRELRRAQRYQLETSRCANQLAPSKTLRGKIAYQSDALAAMILFCYAVIRRFSRFAI